MKTAYDLYLGSFNRGRRWKYNTLLSVFTFTMFSALGRGSVEPLFQLGEPFCWSSEKLGQFTAARSLMQQICGMGLIKVFQKFMTDESIAIMGCISFTIGYVIEGLASSDALIYTVPFVSACGLLTVPMCRALLSKLTRSDQQGAVFAVIATMETLVNLCGSLLSIEIYVETLNLYSGFVFFVYGACSAFCLLQMILYKKYSNKTTPLVKR
ncbi:hypothetical protein DPMN_059910 [Dreissena polymorpha]|uniref:Solute carrier family 46 member 3 n=1 Tax=Dreissena polymorpha TaxID=45954 RepID=A0A9D4C494_DREPO|nr:hypothetical protein DPMN_059910 [Dreissena polymorpha]